jgi:hypothetical protein
VLDHAEVTGGGKRLRTVATQDTSVGGSTLGVRFLAKVTHSVP